jgi:hypothetical protein
MVYAAVFLERSLEQRNIVCIFRDVCREKGDRGGRGEGREESFRDFCVQIAKDNGRSGLVEETDGSSANAICAA